MSFLDKIFGKAAESTIGAIGSVVDRFVRTGDEKALDEQKKREMLLELEAVVTERMEMAHGAAMAEMEAKTRIIEAELKQGDEYTKRARPTLVYWGLKLIIWNYAVVPFVAGLMATFGLETPLAPVELPVAFWAAWGGVTTTWTVGRTMEKRGTNNRFTELANGLASPLGKK